MAEPLGPAAQMQTLPLFPLQTVVFPGGLLALKVFEARYLDLVGRCLREGSGFGIATLKRGGEVRRREADDEAIELESHGVLVELLDVDAAQPGILTLRCRGTRRFALRSFTEQPDGLWVGEVRWLADDPPTPLGPERGGSARALEQAIASLREQGAVPFLEPHRFDDAGWVANRWCELLPIPANAKVQLMRLDDPLVRLQLVDDFLRSQGVVT